MHFKGRTIRSSGHGFCGIGRKRLLNILQDRCIELGVQMRFSTDCPDDADIDADLIVAADGLNSRLRTKYAATYQPDIDLRHCRFVWLGTHKLFDAFTFAFEKTEWGWFQAHAYRFDADTSTFIVEAPEEVWRAAGIEQMEQGRGHRLLRAAVREVPRRPRADQQRVAPARLVAVDPLPARGLRSLGASQRPLRPSC